MAPTDTNSLSDERIGTYRNPPKGVLVQGWWNDMGRWTRAKWTGRRWMRFNDLFGGYDPVEPPANWRNLNFLKFSHLLVNEFSPMQSNSFLNCSQRKTAANQFQLLAL